jgi:hypothetical protein
MESYSVMEFKRDDIKNLNILPKNYHNIDSCFKFENILEFAALDAFWYGLNENSKSQSHHGRNLLTVLYIPQKVSLCEVKQPFSAQYVGKKEDMDRLKCGFDSFFREGARYSETTELDEAKLTSFVETIHPSNNEGKYHTCLALSNIGIKCGKADDSVSLAAKNELLEKLRKREWFRKIEQGRNPSHF